MFRAGSPQPSAGERGRAEQWARWGEFIVFGLALVMRRAFQVVLW